MACRLNISLTQEQTGFQEVWSGRMGNGQEIITLAIKGI